MHAQEIVLELQGSLQDRRLGRRRAAVRRSTPGCTRRWSAPTSSATSPRPGTASPSSSRSPTPGARRPWPPSSDLADRPGAVTMTEQPTWRAAWVVRARRPRAHASRRPTRLLAGGDADEVLAAPPWSPPELAGPLPADLARARPRPARPAAGADGADRHGDVAATATDVVLLGKVQQPTPASPAHASPPSTSTSAPDRRRPARSRHGKRSSEILRSPRAVPK